MDDVIVLYLFKDDLESVSSVEDLLTDLRTKSMSKLLKVRL